MPGLLLLGVLVIVTALAYGSLLFGGFAFLGWDDTTNIVNHPLVSSPSLSVLSGAWTSSTLGVYEPLAVSLKILLVSFFGMRVFPFHVVTLVLHVLNVGLIFVLARRVLTLYDARTPLSDLRPLAGAFVAALFFGLNPIHVEIVAWASGQPYALATFFFLLSIHAYLSARADHLAPGRATRFLVLSFVLYVAAVLSKSAAIVLPAVLLVLDYCPLRRPIAWRLIFEKWLYFVAAVGMSAVVLWATQGAQEHNVLTLDFTARLAYALGAFPFHLGNALWPTNLLPTYPVLNGDVTPWSPDHLLATAGVVVVAVLAWFARERARWFTATVAIYVIGLLPVSGLVAHGAWILGADRYVYLPLLGLWVSLGGWLTSAYVLPRAGWRDAQTWILGGLLVIWLGALAVGTHHQVQHWRSTEALWAHTLRVDPANPTALNNLGFHLLGEDRYDEAESLLVRAVSVNARHLRARLNLGVVLERRGRLEEAARVYQQGLAIYPGAGALHHNLAVVYGKLGRPDEARTHRANAKEAGFRPPGQPAPATRD